MIRRYSGSAWIDVANVKRWSGSAWVNASFARRWDGSKWVDLLGVSSLDNLSYSKHLGGIASYHNGGAFFLGGTQGTGMGIPEFYSSTNVKSFLPTVDNSVAIYSAMNIASQTFIISNDGNSNIVKTMSNSGVISNRTAPSYSVSGSVLGYSGRTLSYDAGTSGVYLFTGIASIYNSSSDVYLSSVHGYTPAGVLSTKNSLYTSKGVIADQRWGSLTTDILVAGGIYDANWNARTNVRRITSSQSFLTALTTGRGYGAIATRYTAPTSSEISQIIAGGYNASGISQSVTGFSSTGIKTELTSLSFASSTPTHYQLFNKPMLTGLTIDDYFFFVGSDSNGVMINRYSSTGVRSIIDPDINIWNAASAPKSTLSTNTTDDIIVGGGNNTSTGLLSDINLEVKLIKESMLV